MIKIQKNIYTATENWPKMTKLTPQMKTEIEIMIKDMKKEVEESFKSLIKGLERQINGLKEEVENLQNNLTEKNQVIESLKMATDASKDQINELKTASSSGNAWVDVVNRNSKKTPEQLKVISVMADESQERAKKENNIEIFGLLESTKQEITEKKEDDLESLKSIFSEMNIQEPHYDAVFRMKSKDTTKPKPMVVVLKDKAERNKIIFAAKKLKASSNFKDVFLAPDLTESQRIRFKELVQERNKLNEQRNEEIKKTKQYVIRDNKVIMVNIRTG